MRIERRWIVAAAALAALSLTAACRQEPKAGGTAAGAAVKTGYHCPMHPQYHSDAPGNCPICQMQLVPDAAADSAGERRLLYYRNPMDPNVTSPVPAKDSMGMDYIPVYSDEVAASSVPGLGAVRVPAGSETQIGVAVSTVETRALFATIKAPGRVAYDPGLYSAILEYQEARRAHAGVSAANEGESERTVRASRLRLRQLGLSDAQIDDLARPGFDPSNLLLGQPGGRVWVYVDVYDYEAALVKPGQQAEFTSPALPGLTVTGTVKSVDSIVNSETRTLRVRVEAPNPKGDLKPEMYLSATIRASLGTKLAVPTSAVMDTGVRQLAYVQTAPGRFEPREVRVGREASGYYEVVGGLKEGERVVTAANFLIDSESRIRGAAGR